jgi:pimeloyl-ACP methyl ester carboxylesterase
MEPIFTQHQGWKRIYPDLPGMGKTPGANWITTEDQVLDIVLDFIDKVVPGQNFAVAGMSYGGYLARGVIYRRSRFISGLLLTVPMIQPVREKRTLPSQVTLVEDPAILSETEPDLAEALQDYATVQSQKLLDHVKANLFPAAEIADHTFLAKLKEHYAFSFDVDELPEPLAVPTLILCGRQDSTSGYHDAWGILENYPRGTFIILDRAAHGLEVEQENLFRTLVSEWLDRVEENIGSQY